MTYYEEDAKGNFHSKAAIFDAARVIQREEE
jgi:hypothetical protein